VGDSDLRTVSRGVGSNHAWTRTSETGGFSGTSYEKRYEVGRRLVIVFESAVANAGVTMGASLVYKSRSGRRQVTSVWESGGHSEWVSIGVNSLSCQFCLLWPLGEVLRPPHSRQR